MPCSRSRRRASAGHAVGCAGGPAASVAGVPRWRGCVGGWGAGVRCAGGSADLLCRAPHCGAMAFCSVLRCRGLLLRISVHGIRAGSAPLGCVVSSDCPAVVVAATGATGFCSESRCTAYEPEVLLWVASCHRTARRWWPPPGQWPLLRSRSTAYGARGLLQGRTTSDRPFSSAGIGRSRAGGENLDPVPEGVVAVESFEALQCPTFGPVHLVP